MTKQLHDENDLVTKGYLKKEFKHYPTRIEMQMALDSLERRMDEKLQAVKDEILTKLDYIIGELAQMRQEILFLNRDIRDLRATDADHEKRIGKLED